MGLVVKQYPSIPPISHFPLPFRSAFVFYKYDGSNLRWDWSFPKLQQITAFTEFIGPHSFAGKHKEEDEKELILIDVNIYKKGFLPPDQFISLFQPLNIAELLYQGEIDASLVENIRNKERLFDKLKEGVVCKGGLSHNYWMCKIKTYSYLQSLKTAFGQE